MSQTEQFPAIIDHLNTVFADMSGDDGPERGQKMRPICLDERKDALNLPFAMLLFPCGFGGCGGRGPASAMLVIYVVERVDVDDPAYSAERARQRRPTLHSCLG